MGHSKSAVLLAVRELPRDVRDAIDMYVPRGIPARSAHYYIQAEYVLEQMNEITKGEAIVATGVGQHQMWAAQYIDFKHPRTWLTSGSMGTMGFGLPAAIGAQLANPGKLVIDVDGDGSIRMNLGELETLTTYGIAVKVLLLNN